MRLDIPPETLHFQAQASNPKGSVWVSANAGSGKTHVLTERVIRLLLAGADPGSILCLTYTNAAAANMSSRIFARLGHWVMADDAALRSELSQLDGKAPGAERMAKARHLFAKALDAPGGLKVQTIHGFCEAILRRFPLEANIHGHFELLDSAGEADMLSAARRTLFSPPAGTPAPVLQAIEQVIDLAGEHGFEELLKDIIDKRDGIRAFLIRYGDPPEYRFAELFEDFGFDPDQNATQIADEAWPLPGFGKGELERLRTLSEIHDAKNLIKGVIPALTAAFNQTEPTERFESLCDAFLTKEREPKKTRTLIKREVKEEWPELEALFTTLAERIAETLEQYNSFRCLEQTRLAMMVADQLIGGYEAAKASRGLLDFNDLIFKTLALLSRPDVGPWVQYKLDQGIEHILVDEAQDTSPPQWRLIARLAAEFFAGDAARSIERTLFAVGDEKQSIYSFQGADPESFAAYGRSFGKQAKAGHSAFASVPLNLSFRSTPTVLEVVDAVFAQDEARAGLTHDSLPEPHGAIRSNAPGRVELWPVIVPQDIEEPEDWRQPVDQAALPAVQLAEQIADCVASWLGTGRKIGERAIGPGDVLVLVRKRDSFIHALSRALKRRSIAVAGVDRLKLTDHIAVKDLMAIGRVALQPADDLSLAALLRSPLFAVDEAALFELAQGRAGGQSLFSRLMELRTERPEFEQAAEQIGRWRALADRVPVSSFYTIVLAADGVRAALASRLGGEVHEILDEFVTYVEGADQSGQLGLEAFLAGLSENDFEIKREMDQNRDEVRIMTAHAAKGLEAKIVFLVDSGSQPFHAGHHTPTLLPVALDELTSAYLWHRGCGQSQLVSSHLAEIKQKAQAEYRRLLYVGMTRAEDHLIMCGYRGKNPVKDTTWHGYVRAGLESLAGHICVEGEHGVILSYGDEDLAIGAGGQARADDMASREELILPELGPLSEEPLPLPPLSPSLAGYELQETGELENGRAPDSSPVLAPADDRFALERGRLTHRLLQVLPDQRPENQAPFIKKFTVRYAADWPEQQRQAFVRNMTDIGKSEAFLSLCGAGTKAEVPVAGQVKIGGKTRLVSGVIDRLCVRENEVLIVDFKASRRPQDARAHRVEYVVQLALYQKLVKEIYPEKPIYCAIYYTADPIVCYLEQSTLDGALHKI